MIYRYTALNLRLAASNKPLLPGVICNSVIIVPAQVDDGADKKGYRAVI